MVRRMVFGVLLIPALAFAQSGGESSKSYPGAGKCIGGEQCGRNESIRVRLEGRPVVSIRFYADDDIGSTAKGKLRVRIDGSIVEDNIDIPRDGKNFRLDVRSVRGSYLIIEPAAGDEVNVKDVEVIYGSGGGSIGTTGGLTGFSGESGNWKDYSRFDACIGGSKCKARRIRIPLDERPVVGIRFNANDDIGSSANGRLRVKIDGNEIASNVDIKREGKLHEFTVDGVTGSELLIETQSDDEVEVQSIQVQYGSGGYVAPSVESGGLGALPPVSDRGGCIGGSKCGGFSKRITVRLQNRPVDSIRFRANDNVGSRTNGRLRIRIDDNVLEESLDIEKYGKSYTIDGQASRGQYLYIEPSADDEVVVEGLEVRYR